MKKEDIHLSDVQRILFGEAPAIFLVETLIRTLIIYIFLLFITRMLGKRMSGQITITEMAVMLTLGAIVSVAMQVPDRGLAMAMLILCCTLIFERGLSWLDFKYEKIERLTQGDLSILVIDGVLQPKQMLKVKVSNQQVFAELRSKGIFNLGVVKRMYMEASGDFSIFKTVKEKPGLPLFPPDEKDLIAKQHFVDMIACINCGFVKVSQLQTECCEDCGHDQWTKAIVS